jgi:hypothetical protein
VSQARQVRELKADLGGKKRRSVFENPKIDGCEIFWRLNLQTREFADWMRVHE